MRCRARAGMLAIPLDLQLRTFVRRHNGAKTDDAGRPFRPAQVRCRVASAQVRHRHLVEPGLTYWGPGKPRRLPWVRRAVGATTSATAPTSVGG